jgi:Zn-finger nucleic acid-binding protein
MVVLELQEVEIDYCTACHGIWLDGGELELLLEDTDGKDTVISSLTPDTENREKKRKCPMCRKKMKKMTCGTDEKVTVDSCTRAHGIWFDKGELNKTIKMGTSAGESRVLGLLTDMFGNI